MSGGVRMCGRHCGRVATEREPVCAECRADESAPRVTLCLKCQRWHDGACDLDPVLAATIARATSAPEDFLARLERAFAATFGGARHA